MQLKEKKDKAQSFPCVYFSVNLKFVTPAQCSDNDKDSRELGETLNSEVSEILK